MPHFTTFNRFAVVHPEFKSEADRSGYAEAVGLDSSTLDTGAVNERLMGMTTGLGEDKLTGIDQAVGSFNPGSSVESVGGTSRVGYSEVEWTSINDAGTQGNFTWEATSTMWSPAPVCSIGATCTPTCWSGLTEDALIQQVNGTIGYEMLTVNNGGSASPGDEVI